MTDKPLSELLIDYVGPLEIGHMQSRLRALDERHQSSRRLVDYLTGEIQYLYECSCGYDGGSPCPERILLDGGSL